MTKTLAFFLKPGGVILVIDLIKSEDSIAIFNERHEVHHVVAHRGGFYEEEIRSAFQEAGLQDVTFEVIAHARKEERVVQFFLAKGVKKAESNLSEGG